ncbi:hypothetical protein Acy02nite_90450 [Actinoplanes cyaneus]|uniref:RHIM domain-containing protein n=1 Tax=Actinoplanes cyaneus TaxID=52696 RepID=A0A919MCY9_9ACTN|nr:hypothetical protein [Actinoplanes cyaneus]MCW2144467.1 RIP homotypic interaction motif-containing protein [Actinoplanes cyaneus]GID71164.1 hypothetical protein Acy02nite_90450 [Actinoplanes cyaneus]
MVSELELILAALAAGAGAGSATVAQTAVVDAYNGLRSALRSALSRHGGAAAVLNTVETAPDTWQATVGEALSGTGVDRDAEVLAAARRLLKLADPDGSVAGKYTVDVSNSTGVQVGDHAVHIDTLNGNNIGTMTGPMHISYGQAQSPPTAPGA